MDQNKSKEISDEDLVDTIVKTKSSTSFALLYDRYSEKVYHKCLSFTKSVEEAQDLTHDIFIKLFMKLPTFKKESKFSTWLYSFTYNFCVNYVERSLNKKKKKFVSSAEVYENKLYSKEISDEEIYELKTDKLQKSLSLLDTKNKALLLMKYQDDFSIKEIMQALDIGESATKMRLNRAKASLIDIYNKL